MNSILQMWKQRFGVVKRLVQNYFAHKWQCQDSNPKIKIAFEEEKMRKELIQHLFCARHCWMFSYNMSHLNSNNSPVI